MCAGFTIMTIILIILASAFYQIKKVSIWLFVVMYALTFFFANVRIYPLFPPLSHTLSKLSHCLVQPM